MVRQPKIIKIHAPVEFRNALYKLKSEDSSQTLNNIMKNLGKQIKSGEIKLSKSQDDFWE